MPISRSSNNVELMARRLEEDIQRRRLSPGDRYLTADEAGRMLDVSSVTAHRAMRLLADRDILIRQRKAGTFIGTAVAPPAPAPRQFLHFIIAKDVGRDRAAALDYLSNELVTGMVETMPGVAIQIDIVGPEDSASVVRTIIEGAQRASDEFAGAILVRSSLEAQRRFAESGLPAVVYGTLYPGVKGLASLDVDHDRIGQLTARYVLRSGRHHLTTLMFNHWSPGDNAFMSAYLTALQAGHKDVVIDVRSIPPDDDVIVEEATSLLASKGRPDIIVARSPSLLRHVVDVAQKQGLRIPEDVTIVMGNHHRFEMRGAAIPGARCCESMRDEGRRLGAMLQAIGANAPQCIVNAVVPVEFSG